MLSITYKLLSNHVLVPFSRLRWVQPAQSEEKRKRWLASLYPQFQSSSPLKCSSCLSLTFLPSERQTEIWREKLMTKTGNSNSAIPVVSVLEEDWLSWTGFYFSYLCFLQNTNILEQIYDQYQGVLIKTLCAYDHIRCKNFSIMNHLFQQWLEQ